MTTCGIVIGYDELGAIQAEAEEGNKPSTHTWGSIFRCALARGDDHGHAAYLADEWEKRQQRRTAKRSGVW